MALSVGDRLGSYEILGLLGAGGMGEVYRATDSKLGREVAIKVLPAEVAQDPARLERFQREARLLASLNHPSIAAIYGLEEADGRPFLVLELVEGEDLKARLDRGAIPVDEALETATQVAEALEEAHNRGIVHRDLKPANVKLTQEGKVKVLDFGLAKAWAGDGTEGGASSGSMSQSPTLVRSGTEAGVILGTAAYMSPEQARGKPVDKRGDVWAFGVLLWEMLTGRALFSGETVTDVIAAVMTREPDLDALPAGTPATVRHLVSRCLRRDPRQRLPDIGAARLDLQDTLGGAPDHVGSAPSDEAGPGAPATQFRARQKWAWAVAGLALGCLATGALFMATREELPAPLHARFAFEATEAFTDIPAVSPDGRHVAFTGRLGDSEQLWVRSLDSLETRPLPGTEGGLLPFWSPDGAWIAYFVGSELNRVRLDGGRIHRICTLPRQSGSDSSGSVGVRGGAWSDSGTIVFAIGFQRARLFTVAAAGGDPRPLTTHDDSRGETSHEWPWFLPGGQLLFVVGATENENAGLHVTTLDAPDERQRLLSGLARVTYGSGHLLYVRDSTLSAQPFDAQTLEASGAPVPLARNIGAWLGGPATGLFGVSPSGVLAYRERRRSDKQLVWLDREGEPLGSVGEPGLYGQIALAPDQRRVALEIQEGDWQGIWIMDAERGVTRRVTTDRQTETNPVWSPDGQELAFAAGDDVDIQRMGLRGGAATEALLDTSTRTWPEEWSRDGQTLLYVGGNSLWALPLAGGAPPEPILKTASWLAEPRLSPDGRWLAYISNESGAFEVYVAPYDRPGEAVRVSVDGGGQPKWREDGKELFYITFPGHRMMAVSFQGAADRIEVGLPTELFEMDVVQYAQSNDYAVTADGQRFLVKVPAGEPVEPRIHVTTHWPSLLE